MRSAAVLQPCAVAGWASLCKGSHDTRHALRPVAFAVLPALSTPSGDVHLVGPGGLLCVCYCSCGEQCVCLRAVVDFSRGCRSILLAQVLAVFCSVVFPRRVVRSLVFAAVACRYMCWTTVVVAEGFCFLRD